MGEARRRTAAEVSFQDVSNEGQGLMRIDIYTLQQAVDLVRQATYRTKLFRDLTLMETLADFARRRDTPDPYICACCGGPVARPVALVIYTPHIDQPTMAIAGAVCPTCNGSEAQIRERALAAWREDVDPNIRLLMVPPEGGHA